MVLVNIEDLAEFYGYDISAFVKKELIAKKETGKEN